MDFLSWNLRRETADPIATNWEPYSPPATLPTPAPAPSAPAPILLSLSQMKIITPRPGPPPAYPTAVTRDSVFRHIYCKAKAQAHSHDQSPSAVIHHRHRPDAEEESQSPDNFSVFQSFDDGSIFRDRSDFMDVDDYDVPFRLFSFGTLKHRWFLKGKGRTVPHIITPKIKSNVNVNESQPQTYSQQQKQGQDESESEGNGHGHGQVVAVATATPKKTAHLHPQTLPLIKLQNSKPKPGFQITIIERSYDEKNPNRLYKLSTPMPIVRPFPPLTFKLPTRMRAKPSQRQIQPTSTSTSTPKFIQIHQHHDSSSSSSSPPPVVEMPFSPPTPPLQSQNQSAGSGYLKSIAAVAEGFESEPHKSILQDFSRLSLEQIGEECNVGQLLNLLDKFLPQDLDLEELDLAMDENAQWMENNSDAGTVAKRWLHKCTYCGAKVTGGLPRYRVHLANFHSFSCKCGQIFTNKVKIGQHISQFLKLGDFSHIMLTLIKKEQVDFECDLCEETFKTSNQALKHRSEAHGVNGGVPPLECPHCQLPLRSQRALKKHLKSCTEVPVISPPPVSTKTETVVYLKDSKRKMDFDPPPPPPEKKLKKEPKERTERSSKIKHLKHPYVTNCKNPILSSLLDKPPNAMEIKMEKQSISQHMKIMMMNKKEMLVVRQPPPVKCVICASVFLTKEDFRNHFIQFHKGISVLGVGQPRKRAMVIDVVGQQEETCVAKKKKLKVLLPGMSPPDCEEASTPESDTDPDVDVDEETVEADDSVEIIEPEPPTEPEPELEIIELNQNIKVTTPTPTPTPNPSAATDTTTQSTGIEDDSGHDSPQEPLPLPHPVTIEIESIVRMDSGEYEYEVHFNTN